jgi:hypothetical protein
MADLVSGNLKRRRMLALSDWCKYVAPPHQTRNSLNRHVATQLGNAGPRVPSSTFGRKQAQTENGSR